MWPHCQQIARECNTEYGLIHGLLNHLFWSFSVAKNLPVWLFLSIALVLIGAALLPLFRVILGVDVEIGMDFFTVVMLMIGGLMSGLSAMIMLVRRAPSLEVSADVVEEQKVIASSMHASGLLLFSGVPLLNFLTVYWLWVKHRHESAYLNWVGREVLNFQITIYLYLLLSLFMVFAALGVVTTPLLLAFHFLATTIGIFACVLGKRFRYPANIPVIQGRRAGS